MEKPNISAAFHTISWGIRFRDRNDLISALDCIQEAGYQGVFTPIARFRDTEELLLQYRDLSFLPDTAHLTIVHDDPVEAIERFIDRTVAVHFKDWTAAFGRACHRYARGFVELGAGDVDF